MATGQFAAWIEVGTSVTPVDRHESPMAINHVEQSEEDTEQHTARNKEQGTKWKGEI